MKTSRLLYLDTHQVTAYRWRSGELTGEGIFAADDAGRQQFADYLRRGARGVYTLLANVSEEGFHVETLPFLRGADRQAVIERKLGQLYFNAALTTSLSLGYEKSRRKDERILLTALTNKDLFSPWLEAIAKQHIRLSGIYSLPLLAPALLRRLGIEGEPCLLLSVQDQSVRQSYFEKGELHFSRLTPLHNSSISGIAQSFSAEAQKLQQYLASQRMIGRQQSITAYLLAHANARKAIEQCCSDTTTIRYAVLDIDDCASRTGLKNAPPDSHCEPLFLNLLAVAPPRTQFADDSTRHDHHLGQIRSALHALGAAALLGCLLFSGKLLFEAYTVGAQTQVLKDEAAGDRQRYQEIVKTFPKIPTDTETLRHVIDRYVALEQRSTSPEGLYREISQTLQSAPAAEIESIDWQLGGADPGVTSDAGPAVAAGKIAGDSETAIMRGVLKLGAKASARQVLAAFNDLLDALNAKPGLQVGVLQRPFDIESAKSLRGSDTTIADSSPRSFAVQITRKLTP